MITLNLQLMDDVSMVIERESYFELKEKRLN